MPVTGQLFVFTQGSLADGRLFRINSDTTSQTVIADNTPTTDLVTQFPQEIGVDTAAGRYFAIVNGGNLGLGARLVTGLLSGGAATVLVNYDNGNGFDDDPSTTDDPIVNALHVDPINHKIYVGVQAVDGGTPGSTGIRAYDYNPASGAVTGGAFITTVSSSGKPQEDGFDIFDVRDFAFDPLTNNLFFTERLDGGVNVEGLWRVNLGSPDTVTQVVSQTQFPDDHSNGYIIDVEVDRTTGLVYFSTESNTPSGGTGYNAALNKIYYITETASGGTATALTLSGLPGGAVLYPSNMALDPQARVLYVASEEVQADTAASNDVIYRFQLDAAGTIATYLGTIVASPVLSADTVHFGGMVVNVIPVLSGLIGTATHAAEQGASIALLTGQPTLTDIDGGYLASATVAVTAGGSFLAGDDVLSATTGGTGITASYNSVTETLTLSGYDTLANYKSVLASVRYNSTGDNPTNYGANTTRTLTWTASDGAAGIPAGSQNSGTTTITVDAVNDAPVNTVGATATLAEDAANVALTGISIADADADPASAVMTVALSVLHGTLSMTTPAGGSVTGNGSATLSVTGTQNAINAVLSASGLTYTPAANFNGTSDALHVVTSDGGATGSGGTLSDTDDKAISVTAVNDAPTVVDATQTVADIYEDQPSSAGTLVSTLFAGSFSDALDTVSFTGGSAAHTLAGIAIVGGSTNANGDWQYLNGAVWTNIGATTTATAHLISAATAIRFNPAADYNGPAPTLSVHLIDSSGAAITNNAVVDLSAGGATGGITRYSAATVALDQAVLAVNDRPTSTGLASDSASWTEGGAAVLLDVGGNATIDDIDSANFDTGTLTVAIASALPQDGLFIGAVGTVTSTATTVSVGGTQIATYTGGGFNGGSLVFTLDADATSTSVQALVRAIQYNNNAGDAPTGGTRTVNWTLVDGDGTANGGTDTLNLSSSVQVVPVNDAPLLDNTKAPALASEAEDAAAPSGAVGTLVSSLIDYAVPSGQVDNATDADGPALGIAVTAADTTNGSWHYSLNGGTNWFALGAITGTTARLLPGTARLYFQPNANYNGTIGSAITFHAWDQSAGTSGSQADATVNGLATAFSTATDTASLTISAVNDAPTATGLASDSASWTEGGAAVLLDVGSDAAIDDVDSANFDTGTLTVAIASALAQDGLFIGAVGTVTSTATTVSVGGTQIATYTGGGFNGGSLVFTLDADATSTSVQALVRAIQYNNNAGDAPTGGTRTVNWTLTDGDGGADTLNVSSSVVVGAVNDAPVNSVPGAQSVFTGGSLTFNTANGNAISFSDADVGGANMTLTLTANHGTLALGSAAGLFSVSGDGTATIIAVGTQANLNNALQGLTYAFTSGYSGSATLTVLVNDAGNTGTGGVQSDSDIINITVLDQNQAPTSTNLDTDSVTWTEGDGAKALDNGGNATIADANSANFDTGTLTVAIASALPQDGLFIGAVGTVTSTATTVSVGGTQIATYTGGGFNGGSLVFTFDADATPTAVQALVRAIQYNNNAGDNPTAGTRTVNWTLVDGDGTANGGADTLSLSSSVVVAAVNDAPVVTTSVGTAAFTEDGGAVTIDGALTLGDPDSANIAGATVAITSGFQAGQDSLVFINGNGISGSYNTGTGVLTLSGTTTVANYQAALRSVAYANSSDDPASAARVVTFTATDSGAATSTGATRSVSITAVNDAPVNTVPAAVSTNEDTPFTFSGGNLISIGDADAGAGPVKVTLTGSSGLVTLSQTTGLSFTTGDGTSDAAMTFTGTPTNINAALSGLVFAPTANFNGSASLQIVTNDQGSTGNGGAKSDTDTIAITVDPINDAPAGTNKTVSTAEDTAYVFTVADFGFSDPNDSPANVLGAVKVAALPAAGTLKLDGIAVAAGDFIAVADITAGKLAFTPAANANGAGYASFTFQVQDNGGTASGGVDLDASANTMTIDVSAVNDAPVNSKPAAVSTNEDTPFTFSGGNLISISDVDAGTDPVKVTLTGTQGTVSLSQTTGLSFTTGDGTADSAMTFTGTLANINAALSGLVFAPTTNFNGPASLQIVTNDQGSTGSGGALTDTDTIAITVGDVNDAPVGPAVQNIVVAEDQPSAVLPIGAGDIDGDTLTYALKPGFGPGKGTVSVLTGAFRYDPAQNISGADSFVLVISDGRGGVLEQTVNVTITPVNDDPLPVGDTASVLSGNVLTLSAATLLANDGDVDGGPLSLVSVQNPAGGTVALAGGTVTFTPASGFVGNGGFDYTVSDGLGGFGAAHVTVAVGTSNFAPVVNPAGQTLVTLTGTPRTLTVTATDANGDALTYLASTPAHGTVTGGAGGVFTYTPSAGYLGNDGFTITVSDGKGGSAVQAETISVIDLPQADDWRLFAAAGFGGEIGGSGRVFGNAGFQDIAVLDLPGTVDFDGSFNRGGDVVRLQGPASRWAVSLSGSAAVFTDGDTFVVLPVGVTGQTIGFGDGMRSLRFDAATSSVRIGAQAFGSEFVAINTPADGSTAPGAVNPATEARLFLFADASATIGGHFEVVGSVAGDETLTVNYGQVQLDGSFNRGGDTLVLPQLANTFQASVTGSSLFLDGLVSEVRIPIGTNGMELEFTGGDSRTLLFDAAANAVLVGIQPINAIPIALTNFA